MPAFIDVHGQVFGRLTALAHVRLQGYRTRWRCRCSCGRVTLVSVSKLLNGHTASCGCLQREATAAANQRRRMPADKVALNSLFYIYQKVAAQRSREWRLSRSQFKKLVFANCHYCGARPANKARLTRRKLLLVYNGLDRQDNRKGYLPDNVVTCCRICNKAKNNLSVAEWGAWVARLSARFRNTQGWRNV